MTAALVATPVLRAPEPPMPKTLLPLSTPDDTEAAYYDALLHADLEQLMACWSDEDDIVCVLPGTHRLIGHAQIRAAFEALMTNGSIRVVVENLHKTETASSTIHSALVHVSMGAADRPEDLWLFVTSVYVKTAHGWRLVAHHASPGMQESVTGSWVAADTTLH
ncbi:nuclear transport factor 2 family protein [Hydrogenophaga sp. 5NK40-0174]|uniref:YybH family protein n=1 Tax=Hydrogenophaga sp. 5NK40-0174 TaxID=3127649 RepID=UPI0031071A0D